MAGHGDLLAGGFAGVLLALAVVTILARATGAGFARLGQPPVVGEIVAGLVLGPSVLGRLSPGVEGALFPPPVVGALDLLSRLGIVLFLFLVGLELEPRVLRRDRRVVLGIGSASVTVPFVLGGLLGLALHGSLAPAGVGQLEFSLFLGTAISVTAFPVLARILADRGLQRTRLGSTALSCAALNDAVAWILLLLVAGLVRSRLAAAAWTVPVAVAAVGAVFVLAPLALRRFLRAQQAGDGPLSRSALSVVLAAVLVSAFATEAAGIHALFGAFLLGAVLPHEGRLPEQLRARLEDLVMVLFLPSFFVVTGLRVQLGAIASGSDLVAALLVLVVAASGKIGGTTLAARAAGFDWRGATTLGILANTRGLMELVVLQVGLDLGVIDHRLFTMLALMAIVTTGATAPLLDRVLPGGEPIPLARPRGIGGIRNR